MTAATARPRVLLLFPGALGDAVCLEPAASWLAHHGALTLYARGAAAEVAALYPEPPEVRSLDAPEIARLFAPDDAAEPADVAWLDGFARIVSFTGASVPQVVSRLEATGRARVAPFPRSPATRHAADALLAAVSGEPTASAPPPRLVLPARAERVPGGPPRLALLPGSGGRDKRAPAELFVALARRWREAGGEPLVVLGPAEGDERGAWQAAARVEQPATVVALARCLAGSAAFIGNDAGPSHVAAALGIPGAVLYRVTSPRAFGPRGAAVRAVRLSDGAHDGAVDAAWDAVCGGLA